jgi:hypothetical protein
MRPDRHALGGPVSLKQPLPWFVAGGLFLFAILFFIPVHTEMKNPSSSRLAFSGSTSKPIEWVEMCLGKDWGGRLSLRHRQPPEASKLMARLDNPVRHFVVDVIDEGTVRVMKAYSRSGAPFSDREREALDGCLTGAAFALGDPRNR